MALHKKMDLPEGTLVQPLEALLSLSADDVRRDRGQSDRYHIQQLIESLQQNAQVDQQRLAFLEFHFIEVLDEHSGHAPIVLRKQLAESPSLFNEILSVCYRPRNRDKAEDTSHEPDPQHRYMATHGFRLLHEWDVIPGTDENGVVREVALRAWCVEARRIAAEADRLEICDEHIGQVFARSEQTDDDQSWPCRAIRRVAEEIKTLSLSSGMFCGICNSRGATWRSSGGDLEREEEEKYRRKAELIRFDCPLVAGILDSVADSYHREAARWDDDARWGE